MENNTWRNYILLCLDFPYPLSVSSPMPIMDPQSEAMFIPEPEPAAKSTYSACCTVHLTDDPGVNSYPGRRLGISFPWKNSDSCSLQKQQEKKEKAKYERRDVAESVWRAGSLSSSIVSGSMWTLIFTALFPSVILSYEVDTKKLNGLAKARVELNRLREVKAFVTQDIPLYHNLVMKHIPGADPELVLLNHYYEELDRIPLSEMTRTEINKLLETVGFYKKENPEDQVPEEFRFAPAKDSPFEGQSTVPPPKTDTDQSEADSQHTDL
ncbi:hypothetical protein G5714_006271 [Onychostoma macrolepis]|uniref:Selenoprotein M n=1 Tax=Onychostoma macrolepis TaxID=369639 RepID=A0A7J6D3D5_9TELE|nr:hypothetical protein G5714_006271 [Onychostoma macrolepis]